MCKKSVHSLNLPVVHEGLYQLILDELGDECLTDSIDMKAWRNEIQEGMVYELSARMLWPRSWWQMLKWELATYYPRLFRWLPVKKELTPMQLAAHRWANKGG